MSAEHLSPLELEEAAAGLPSVVGTHLETCSACQAKVAELKTANDGLRALPQFQSRLASVMQQVGEKPIARMDPETGELTVSRSGPKNAPAPTPPMPVWRWLMPTLALAISVLAFVFWPKPPAPADDIRLKGSPTLRVVGADGRGIEKAKPGQTVELAVGGAGYTQGLVVSVDANGQVEVLWPRGASLSSKLPPGAGAHLQPGFEVTPGSLKLFALFGDGPFNADAAIARVTAAVNKARAAGQSPLQAEVPPTDTPVASATLQVEP